MKQNLIIPLIFQYLLVLNYFVVLSISGSTVMSPVLLPGGKVMVSSSGGRETTPVVLPLKLFGKTPVGDLALNPVHFTRLFQSTSPIIGAESMTLETVVRPPPTATRYPTLNKNQQHLLAMVLQQQRLQEQMSYPKYQLQQHSYPKKQEQHKLEDTTQKLLLIIQQQRAQLAQLAKEQQKQHGESISSSDYIQVDPFALQPEDANPWAPDTKELLHEESNETITYGPIIKTTKIICDERIVYPPIKILDVRVASGKVCSLRIVKTQNCDGPDPIIDVNPNLPPYCDGLLKFLNTASSVVQVVSSIPKKLEIIANEAHQATKHHLIKLNDILHFYDPDTFAGNDHKEGGGHGLPAEYTTSTIIKS